MSLNYVTLGTNDLDRARRYYDAVMPVLGGEIEADYPGFTFCYRLPGGGRIWVGSPYDKGAAAPGNGITFGLFATDHATVDAAHAAALANGGSSEGEPGPRPQYGPDFYGAYAHDPDGNKMSFVHFGQ
jgi:catechol 2,3-dioxygenase-like lactoylglutathione lyase family enzyme